VGLANEVGAGKGKGHTVAIKTSPTIHLNGTSRESLLEAIEEAHAAIREAQVKLAETAPNGRDYYPQGPAAHDEAVKEHNARMTKLVDVQHELEELAEEIVSRGRS
jgi:hypothetical protein